MYLQKTIKEEISFEGIGIHSGKLSKVTLRPSETDTGINFWKVIDNKPKRHRFIPGHFLRVTDTKFGTTLSNLYSMDIIPSKKSMAASVSTIEHLMATLYAFDISNLIIEIEGSEIPIMDGSCKFFVDLLEKVGVIEQDEPEYFLNICNSVRVEEDDSFAEFHPGDGLEVDLKISFNNAVVKEQQYYYKHNLQSFKEELSQARTFGFLEEVKQLQSLGYAVGGSLDNSVVVADSYIMNEEGLRYEDEFVRHKIVDVVGDMSLCGYRINGKFKGYKTGHSLNNKLLRKVFSDKNNFKINEL